MNVRIKRLWTPPTSFALLCCFAILISCGLPVPPGIDRLVYFAAGVAFRLADEYLQHKKQ